MNRKQIPTIGKSPSETVDGADRMTGHAPFPPVIGSTRVTTLGFPRKMQQHLSDEAILVPLLAFGANVVAFGIALLLL